MWIVFLFKSVFNFPCNVTTCRFGDFDVNFTTQFLKSYINYVWPQGQHHAPRENFWVRLRLLLLLIAGIYEVWRSGVF